MAEEKTKEELLEEARDRDIKGRSSMSKEELEEALSDESDGGDAGSGEVGTRTVMGGVTSVTLNPEEQQPASASQVVGSEEIEDSGELEYTPEALAGVSQDRWFKPADHHAYPVETDADRAAREGRQAEIDAANAQRESERVSMREAEDAAARKRLTDLINGK